MLGPCRPATAKEPADELIAKARAGRLWEDRYWRLLLHYEPSLMGLRSGIRNRDFFLAPNGRSDPQAEMEASIRAFFTSHADPDQDVRCRFPLRAEWLGDRLGFSPDLLRKTCPKYQQWREAVHVDSVTLVFASAYLNNPSSMYGHTFLRLDQSRHAGKDKLLDYAVNFAADDSSTNNPILYIFYGLTGRFPGSFSAMPYYLKVQEYNNLESRDLWEYRLNFDAAAVDRLAAHIWEMDKAEFGYYFFNKNCSYQLLPLLEAADPRLRLIPHWQPWVIPTNTVRAVVRQPGVPAAVHYRPSRITLMLWRRSRLQTSEARLAARLLKPEDAAAWTSLSSLPKDRQALILDSAADYRQYLSGFRPKRESESKGILRKILVSRGSLGIPSPPDEVPAPAPPDQGHETFRVGSGYGFGDRHFFEADLRPALHDLLDPLPGYAPDSTLEMLHARLRHDLDADKNYVQSLDLVHILSLSPYDQWILSPSWTMDMGWRTAQELDPRPWKAGYFGIGAGSGLAYATHWFRRELAYAMAQADTGAGGILHQDYRLGGGGTAAWLVELLPGLNVQAKAGYIAYGLGGDRRPVATRGVEGSWAASRNLSLRLKFESQRQYDETMISVQGFF